MSQDDLQNDTSAPFKGLIIGAVIGAVLWGVVAAGLYFAFFYKAVTP